MEAKNKFTLKMKGCKLLSIFYHMSQQKSRTILAGPKMEANKIYSSEIWVDSRLGANMEANSILILYMEGSPKMEVDKT